MKNFRKLAELAKQHHHIPKINPKTRYKGILLSLTAWAMFAIFTYSIENISGTFNIRVAKSALNKRFFEFALIHLPGVVIFFFCCLKQQGIKSLKPKEPSLILWRSGVAILSFWFYSFARIWTATIDNSLQYSTDTFWVLLILLYLKQKISNLALLGIIISFLGIIYVYFSDSKSYYDLIGCGFGIGAGMTLAIITVITVYLVKQDPPVRIGFYQMTVGFLSSLLMALLISLREGINFPNIHEITISFGTGLLFSALLYMIWKSFYYTEPYILSATSYTLPLFLIIIAWIIGEIPMNKESAIGVIIITAGGVMTVLDSYRHHINSTHQ